MENLKNTITKTDTLKNNLKTVTNQIKQSIVRRGGSDFKSLAETPKAIESLIKEYNKVAIGTINGFNKDFPQDEYGIFVDSVDVTIKYNLSFNPQKLILVGCDVSCIYDNRHSNTIPENAEFEYSKDDKNTAYLYGMFYLDTYEFKKLGISKNSHPFRVYIEIKKFNNKEIVLTLSHNRYDNAQIANISIGKFKFIAIG